MEKELDLRRKTRKVLSRFSFFQDGLNVLSIENDEKVQWTRNIATKSTEQQDMRNDF